MKINIATPLHPFSHIPGVLTIIPGTELQVQVFPMLLRFYSDGKMVKEIPLSFEPPEKNFTVENDLERGVVSVWWHSSDGFTRFHLRNDSSGMVKMEDKNGSVDLYQTDKPVSRTIERLSLGVSKKQDIDRIRKDLNIAEIWPFWFQLGQMVPNTSGSCDLLNLWRSESQPEKIEGRCLPIFKAGFQGIMSPRSLDEQHQGIKFSVSGSPLILLSEGSKIIRSHFIRIENEHIYILPLLPPQLHCGRMTNIQIHPSSLSPQPSALDLEWSKKTIRRMVFHSHQAQEHVFHFRHCKEFRLRKSYKDKGLNVNSGDSISFEQNCDYFFDNFS